MPGIAGIITKYPKGDEGQIISLMSKTMSHEDFYNNGLYQNKEAGFFVGFSVIKNSFADCMPMFNESKDLVMFLTGEIYEDQAVIFHLKKGHEFNPDNASYLIHRYEEFGDNLFKDLNGWYNGILIDLCQKKAIIFNDRYGIRRLYLYEHPDFLAFASEAKAF